MNQNDEGAIAIAASPKEHAAEVEEAEQRAIELLEAGEHAANMRECVEAPRDHMPLPREPGSVRALDRQPADEAESRPRSRTSVRRQYTGLRPTRDRR